MVMLIFFLLLTLGFAFELGKNALKIDSRQMFTVANKRSIITSFVNIDR
jgi:NADH-ubiquinone oxidoreductase chain 3